ncbi:hypothetical protein BDV12DRAFT_61685 [Aspergillus spectabilis]
MSISGAFIMAAYGGMLPRTWSLLTNQYSTRSLAGDTTATPQVGMTLAYLSIISSYSESFCRFARLIPLCSPLARR